ncbi:thioredoxin family protein [Flavobacteriaceae bacterium]|nr:thioredoxin family protein [Flavobacteriaceae bacterium]
MKNIKVLGTGCSNCKIMAGIVKEVATENNIDVNIEKIEDIEDIMEYNVMSTPALVINNVVVIKGRIPSKNEVLALLNS